MNRLRTLHRRVAAGMAVALLGLAGAVTLANPASAEQADLSGQCAWDADASAWEVTWTLTATAPEEGATYRLNEVDGAGHEVDGIPATTEAGYPHDPHQPLAGMQHLPEGATSASVSLQIEWHTGQVDNASAALTIPADCEAPAPAVELGQWSFDCHTLTITVENTTGADLALTFAPSAGGPVDVALADGESTTVGFPAADGLSVDILHEGQSIVDPADPIQITTSQWAELDCEANGAGGDLPATGTPTGLIVVGALALVGLGAGLFLIAWRRRIIFTA